MTYEDMNKIYNKVDKERKWYKSELKKIKK